jgi:hypothetical protein
VISSSYEAACLCLLLQVERLSDNRQDVRQAACNLLLELLQVRCGTTATLAVLGSAK